MALANTNSTLVVSLSQRLANISVKSQFMTIFSFVSRRVSVAALQVCGCDLKDPLCMNGGVTVLINFSCKNRQWG